MSRQGGGYCGTRPFGVPGWVCGAAGVPGAGGPGCGAGLLGVPVGGGPPAVTGPGCLWLLGCSGRRRARPPARLGVLTSFGAAPRSPPVPSGPSGALHTGGAWSLMCGSARRLEARPGPAAAHGHRSLALWSLRVLPQPTAVAHRCGRQLCETVITFAGARSVFGETDGTIARQKHPFSALSWRAKALRVSRKRTEVLALVLTVSSRRASSSFGAKKFALLGLTWV